MSSPAHAELAPSTRIGFLLSISYNSAHMVPQGVDVFNRDAVLASSHFAVIRPIMLIFPNH